MLRPRDLPLLAVFAAVARQGSFTAAARELGVAKSVVSENVRSLEGRCGARLLDRSTRRLRLTDAGALALRSARAIEEAARELAAGLELESQSPSGTLRIATTHDLSPLLVGPAAAAVLKRHPGMQVAIVADDSLQDLIKGRFDLSVRLGTPRDSNYIFRRLALVPEPILAAPQLAEGAPHIARPRQLTGAPWVRHSLVGLSDQLTFLGPRGQRDTVVVSLRAQANSGHGVRALLLAGAGYGVLPEYQVAEDLRAGTLVRICPGWVWKNATLHALLPSAKHPPRRVAVFLEALREQLSGGALWLQPPAP